MKEEYRIYEEKMNKTLDSLQGDFASVRAGRANAQVLDKIKVEYYGAPTPINQIGGISSPDSRTLVIQPWDKTALKLVEKAINESDLGIHPQNDGTCIRLSESAKVAIRNIRRDAMDTFKAQKKKSEITDDDLKDIEKDMQDLTDKKCKEIDTLLEKKQKELMSV